MINTFAEAEWLNLSGEQCNSYAGNGDKIGECRIGGDCGCRSYFKRAKKICRKAGGRLPSRNDFRRLASQCGFRFTEFGSLKLSSKSRQCLNKKGFGVSGSMFWTRTRDPGFRNRIIVVDLGNAIDSMSESIASGSSIVSCIK